MALFILVSGMHVTFATHQCRDELAGVKWSFTGKTADCGMENIQSACPSHNGVHSNCCKNHITHYSVDNIYKYSSSERRTDGKAFLHLFCVPITFSLSSIALHFEQIAQIRFADKISLTANVVSLSDICVFRI